MSKWGRNPPSAKRVKLVFAVVLICAALYGVEQLVGFPDWLTPNRINPKLR